MENITLLKPSRLELSLFTGSMAAGGVLGYCNAKGISIDKLAVEFALKFGPSFVNAAIDGMKGNLAAYGAFPQDGADHNCHLLEAGMTYPFLKNFFSQGFIPKKFLLNGYGMMHGVVFGASRGAVLLGLGYALGYGLGSI